MYKGRTISALILAAGTSRRMPGTAPKQFLPVNGKPVIFYTLEKFSQSQIMDKIIVTIPEIDFGVTIPSVMNGKEIKTVIGGDCRLESIKHGLEKIDTDYVLIHDGARALTPTEIIDHTARIAVDAEHDKTSIVLPFLSEHDSILQRDLKWADRSGIIICQTPDAMKTSVAKDLIAKPWDKWNTLWEILVAQGREDEITLTFGDPFNFKITTPRDFNMFQQLAAK
jgi:2-C-methyl-D-erythritol 4-phosphate cytidylyltransferase